MYKGLFFIFVIAVLSGCVYHYPPEHPLKYIKLWDCEVPARYPWQDCRRMRIYGVPSKYRCIRTSPYDVVCGYDCKRSYNRVKCATFPGQTCIVGASGHIACGYDCKRGSREVRCAWRYGDTCVVTLSGGVTCGLNCRVVNGNVKCDEAPTFYPEYAEKRI